MTPSRSFSAALPSTPADSAAPVAAAAASLNSTEQSRAEHSLDYGESVNTAEICMCNNYAIYAQIIKRRISSKQSVAYGMMKRAD